MHQKSRFSNGPAFLIFIGFAIDLRYPESQNQDNSEKITHYYRDIKNPTC